jgi:hypothetical protein
MKKEFKQIVNRNKSPFCGGAFGSGSSREDGSLVQTTVRQNAYQGVIG